MTRQITIDPVTRLEGHGRIEIFIDEDGAVEKAYFIVPELRGFEVFVRGRPAEDMPQITPRICGVCPTAHHIVSAKTVDDLWNVEPPFAAKLIRELMYMAFMLEDHALHFYYLAGPDFVVGPSADPTERNVLGLISKVGKEVGIKVIQLRKALRSILQEIGGKAIHPVAGLPGGMAKPLSRAAILSFRSIALDALDFATFTLKTFEDLVLSNSQYYSLIASEAFTNRTYYAGLVDDDNKVNFYEGHIRVLDPEGLELDKFSVQEYTNHIAEHVEPWTYARFAYLKRIGWRGFREGMRSGIMAVAPLARLNVAEGMATPRAQSAYEAFYEGVGGKPCHMTLAMHWARVVEMIYAAERMIEILEEPSLADENVRNIPDAIPTEGFGVVEAPRGLLIHHYNTDERGLITKANLLVATQHNAARIALSIDKAAKSLIHGPEVDQGTLNMIEMAFRAYDPCFACTTHSLPGEKNLLLSFRSARDGKILRTIHSKDVTSLTS